MFGLHDDLQDTRAEVIRLKRQTAVMTKALELIMQLGLELYPMATGGLAPHCKWAAELAELALKESTNGTH